MKFNAICLTVILFLSPFLFIKCEESASLKKIVIAIPPAGNSWVINDVYMSSKVISGSGITGWNDISSIIRTIFRVEQSGTINISLRAKISSGTSKIEAAFEGKKNILTINNVTFDFFFSKDFFHAVREKFKSYGMLALFNHYRLLQIIYII